MRQALQSLMRAHLPCHSHTRLHIGAASFSHAFSTIPADDYDVVIVGGGMVGAAVGCGLASSPLTRALRVALIDSAAAAPSLSKCAVPDQRVSAITPTTVRFFQEVGAWEGVQTARLAPFDCMQVWDYAGLGYTRYKAADVGEPVLGYVVENKCCFRHFALTCRLGMQCSGFAEIINPARVKSVIFPSPKRSSVTASTSSMGDMERVGSQNSTSTSLQPSEEAEVDGRQHWAQVQLDNGRSLRGRLVVGADGGKSGVRAMAGLQTRGWQYRQTAVICTVRVESEHAAAWQRFLPSGPFALLPMGGTYSNIVWSTSPETAQDLKSMSTDDFVVAANRALLEDYGPQPHSRFAELLRSGIAMSWRIAPSVVEQFQVPPRVTECVTERLSFPLSLLHATKYVGNRVALVGDAAHTVHPLAGQGVNLGFGDAAALVKVLRRGVESGCDIGEVAVLEEYEGDRKAPNVVMMAVLDGFQKLFSTDFGPLNLARAAGFNTVHLLGPLKRQIISYAMGSC